MNNPSLDRQAQSPEDQEDSPTGGINLTLVYSLLGIALLAAILFACFIVWPFYIRR